MIAAMPETPPRPFLPRRFGVIETAPVLMTPPERVALYSLVFGRQPRAVLEIGTAHGGSASIICAALDDVGAGLLVCVDSHPQVKPEIWEKIKHRATLITGRTPEAIADARRAAGLPFDFALIDGDHEMPGVLNDIEGALPHLSDDALILLHDAHYHWVEHAIDVAVSRRPQVLADAGLISVMRSPNVKTGAVWGGLRLLRYRRR